MASAFSTLATFLYVIAQFTEKNVVELSRPNVGSQAHGGYRTGFPKVTVGVSRLLVRMK